MGVWYQFPHLPTQWGYGSKSQGSHSSSVRHRVVVILASVGAQHAAPHVRTIDPPEGAVIPARKTNGYRAFCSQQSAAESDNQVNDRSFRSNHPFIWLSQTVLADVI